MMSTKTEIGTKFEASPPPLIIIKRLSMSQFDLAFFLHFFFVWCISLLFFSIYQVFHILYLYCEEFRGHLDGTGREAQEGETSLCSGQQGERIEQSWQGFCALNWFVPWLAHSQRKGALNPYINGQGRTRLHRKLFIVVNFLVCVNICLCYIVCSRKIRSHFAQTRCLRNWS